MTHPGKPVIAGISQNDGGTFRKEPRGNMGVLFLYQVLSKKENMLDLQFIRDNAELLKEAASNKQLDPKVIDRVLELDGQRKELLGKVEAIRREGNVLQQTLKGQRPNDEQIAEGKKLKEQLKDLEPQLKQVEDDFVQAQLAVPNPASADTPIGKDESGNVEVKQWGTKPEFSFTPKTHDELLTATGALDVKRAVKVAGSRAYYLKGELMLLEQAILQHALKFMVGEGFTPMSVPLLVNRQAFVNTGYGPWGLDDVYWNQDGEGLIGTAEVPVTAYYQDELLREVDLPIKMVGMSPCFRREVGSYGKDTKGMFRVHSFTKVEQVVYTVADEDVTREWHEKMLGYAEQILQSLGLHYHVLLMCTGDMGAGQRRKYDVETWFPGQNAFRETHSDSYFNDFQSRRLNIRYQAKDGTVKYVYTLNNTVAATPRLLAAVVENYQQADGSILVPEVLREYMGKSVINAPKEQA
jgi:seryl-tRNA synthetase